MRLLERVIEAWDGRVKYWFWGILAALIIGWVLYSIGQSHPGHPYVDTRDPNDVPCNTDPRLSACP